MFHMKHIELHVAPTKEPQPATGQYLFAEDYPERLSREKKKEGIKRKKRATTYAGVAAPFISRLLDFGGCDRNHKTNIGKKIAKRNDRNTRCGVKT